MSLVPKHIEVATTVSAAAAVTYLFYARPSRKSTQLINDEYNSLVERVINGFAKINPRLADLGKMETYFPEWIHFWEELVLGSAGAGRGIAFLKNQSNAGKELLYMATDTGCFFFFKPLDNVTLVDSPLKEHGENRSNVSEELRQHAKKLVGKCPTKDDIDKMINGTINKVIEVSKNNEPNIKLYDDTNSLYSFYLRL